MRSTRFITFAQVSVLVGVLIPTTLPAQTSSQQTTYRIETLNSLGRTIGGANSINNLGWASGTANKEGDLISHAALWIGGPMPIDLGSFGGPDSNSAIAWPVKNNNGLIVGISDTADN